MKYLILSDNHGDDQIVRELVDKYQKEVNQIIHCGDSEAIKETDYLQNMQYVKGNCDYEDFAKEIVVESGNNRIFVTHGHLYGVNFDLMKLKYRALELDCNIACFGHTHVPVVELSNDLLIVNPGSISQPRIYPPIPTYLILETTKDKYLVNYYNRAHKKIENLSQIINK